jgi:hypothetical protein
MMHKDQSGWQRCVGEARDHLLLLGAVILWQLMGFFECVNDYGNWRNVQKRLRKD